MAAPKGNKFWQARSSHGRKPKFSSPEELWEACQEYFEWVEDNPLLGAKAFSYQGKVTVVDLPKMRAMTIAGLCTFLDVCLDTWKSYGEKEGFSDITTRVETIIRDQKFAGAAADLLNPNIIARDLGLKDKQEVEHSGDMTIREMSDEELSAKIAALAEELGVAGTTGGGKETAD